MAEDWFLKDLNVDTLRTFRRTWKCAATSAVKRLEYLRGLAITVCHAANQGLCRIDSRPRRLLTSSTLVLWIHHEGRKASPDEGTDSEDPEEAKRCVDAVLSVRRIGLFGSYARGQQTTKSDIPALKDILEAVGRIERYVGSMNESEFLENTEKQDAVIRNLEIIGEAARNLPAEFKQRHSHVQWAPIAGMRDRLIHQYFGVNWIILPAGSLALYRRHSRTCPHRSKGRRWTRCNCPVWAQGSTGHSESS